MQFRVGKKVAVFEKQICTNGKAIAWAGFLNPSLRQKRGRLTRAICISTPSSLQSATKSLKTLLLCRRTSSAAGVWRAICTHLAHFLGRSFVRLHSNFALLSAKLQTGESETCARRDEMKRVALLFTPEKAISARSLRGRISRARVFAVWENGAAYISLVGIVKTASISLSACAPHSPLGAEMLHV